MEGCGYTRHGTPASRLSRMASSSALSSMAGTQIEVKRLDSAGDSSFLP